MKKAVALSLLLFTLFTASAQHKQIDTLRAALSKAIIDTDKYQALFKLGKLYYIFYPDSAIIFHQQAFLIAKKHNWQIEEGENLNGIANAYASMGDYATGIQYYFKALKSYESAHYGFGLAEIDNNIGATYIQKEDFKAALPYLLSAIKPMNDYAQMHKLTGRNKMLKPIVLQNLGECYLDLKKPDSAKYYLDACYKSSIALHFKDLIGSIQRDLGEIEELKGNKEAALAYFRQAVLSDHAIDDVENLSIAYLSISKFYHQNKIKDSAKYYAQKALDTAAAGKYVQDILNAGKALYTYYDEDHNVPQAYKYFKIATAAKDSLFNQDKVKQLLTLDFNEKQRQQELQATQKEAENRLRIYILSGGLLVLLLLALIFWRNSNQRKKANRLLSKQKEIIEQQHDQTHKALTELQQTQTQLIQREKMASLGELTAGIAHEIQNPLNFVNNFSELNREMLVEMKEAIDKGDLEEVKAIANSLIENEEKISHHGRRADFIVKGMLQHSRANTGERQLTNINVLAEEFFKLSYQGLRVKDKTFNSELSTHLDPQLPKVNVSQQDMGRVLLNLFNNAFYAVNQRAKRADEAYKPEVILATSSSDGYMTISVKDNGVGIPDAIKEKILQPFFTTKPTGEGTGLGLSLSYDILVKGHNGTLDIISKEGEGSEFIVKLPLN